MVADTSLFSDSFSKTMKSMRAIGDSFLFATAPSTFARLARGVIDFFPYSDAVPFSYTLINSFQVLVTDSYAYSETAARAARNTIETIEAIIDSFAFGDQVGPGGAAANPIGFFTDLANRLVAGLNWLTGGSTAISPTLLAFAMIAALAAVVAIFARRRSGRKNCNAITLAAPPCSKYGAKHRCGGRSEHAEEHKCKCGASW